MISACNKGALCPLVVYDRPREICCRLSYSKFIKRSLKLAPLQIHFVDSSSWRLRIGGLEERPDRLVDDHRGAAVAGLARDADSAPDVSDDVTARIAQIQAQIALLPGSSSTPSESGTAPTARPVRRRTRSRSRTRRPRTSIVPPTQASTSHGTPGAGAEGTSAPRFRPGTPEARQAMRRGKDKGYPA